ncbi:uncharacterized protein LOC135839795 [Planococcus citri]|uniref:uncharacterized protein LOC135839795 n=1 Tax=Planococcus citri TaxID=170843 RepID=UPI0031F92129
MSAIFIGGFLCILSIYISDGSPITNAAKEAPISDDASSDYTSMIRMSEIISNVMTSNDLRSDDKRTVSESLCKSMLMILSTFKAAGTFRSDMTETKHLTNDHEAQQTIIRKISATFQSCQSHEVIKNYTQSIKEIFESTIKENPDLPIDLQNNDIKIDLLQKDGLKSDHTNYSRSISDDLYKVQDDTPDFENLDDRPSLGERNSRGQKSKIDSPKLNSKITFGRYSLNDNKFDRSSKPVAYDDNMASKIFLFDSQFGGQSFDPLFKGSKGKGQKTQFLFDDEPFAGNTNIQNEFMAKVMREWATKKVQE